MAVIERYILKDEVMWVSSERCIYWEQQNALILSDLHLGKTGHFRKFGIPVPQDIFKNDLHRLFHQIQYFKATRLIIVGDLFHSHANKELELFLKWRKDKSDVEINLIKGNHDILSVNTYANLGIDVAKIHMNIGPFCFTHDINSICNQENENNYIFSGHIHPGVKLSGSGKQSLTFPCFYFGKTHAILPAFSLFTGASKISITNEDDVFCLINSGLIKLG